MSDALADYRQRLRDELARLDAADADASSILAAAAGEPRQSLAMILADPEPIIEELWEPNATMPQESSRATAHYWFRLGAASMLGRILEATP